MSRYETTKEDIRDGFIENCLINPILKAKKQQKLYSITDHFTGRSLFLILAKKGFVNNSNEFMDFYFEQAAKFLGKEGLIEIKTNKTASLKSILQGSKKSYTETPERAEKIILLSQMYAANDWLTEAQKTNLNLKEELKL